ncbi:glycine zipper 2TM domain-containing protein [Neptunicella sp. SCSIO 80796]|uniref:glycine zipper 2TM domain-containing protein n=1 Tax=Neptunicella plasticusilytica TaxID=3117012 RepID=UPI003A4D3244
MRSLLFISLLLMPALALATSHTHYAYAKVEQVSAVYDVVSVPQYEQPQVVCREQLVQRDSATPTVLGAIIGGTLGNVIGHNKTNKRIGTVAGAILGGSIGHDIAQTQPAQQLRQVCSRSVVTINQRQLRGYNVTYRYHGQRYTTFMSRHPGNKIKLKIHTTPAFMSSS